MFTSTLEDSHLSRPSFFNVPTLHETCDFPSEKSTKETYVGSLKHEAAAATTEAQSGASVIRMRNIPAFEREAENGSYFRGFLTRRFRVASATSPFAANKSGRVSAFSAPRTIEIPRASPFVAASAAGAVNRTVD